jgi:hypothetical protein
VLLTADEIILEEMRQEMHNPRLAGDIYVLLTADEIFLKGMRQEMYNPRLAGDIYVLLTADEMHQTSRLPFRLTTQYLVGTAKCPFHIAKRTCRRPILDIASHHIMLTLQ